MARSGGHSIIKEKPTIVFPPVVDQYNTMALSLNSTPQPSDMFRASLCRAILCPSVYLASENIGILVMARQK